MNSQALLLTMIIAVFFSSCAIRKVTSHHPGEVPEPYTDVLVLFVEDVHAGFFGLNRASYNKYLRHKFNNEQDKAFREMLSSAFLYQLPHARVIVKSDLFNVDQDYSYNEFIEAITENNIQSLIVVSAGAGNLLAGEINANRRIGYQTYMLDIDRNQLIWFQGGAVGTDNLNEELFAKRIARLAARDLKKNNIIAKSK